MFKPPTIARKKCNHPWAGESAEWVDPDSSRRVLISRSIWLEFVSDAIDLRTGSMHSRLSTCCSATWASWGRLCCASLDNMKVSGFWGGAITAPCWGYISCTSEKNCSVQIIFAHRRITRLNNKNVAVRRFKQPTRWVVSYLVLMFWASLRSLEFCMNVVDILEDESSQPERAESNNERWWIKKKIQVSCRRCVLKLEKTVKTGLVACRDGSNDNQVRKTSWVVDYTRTRRRASVGLVCVALMIVSFSVVFVFFSVSPWDDENKVLRGTSLCDNAIE